MSLKILFVASEAIPFASSGGLGEVMSSLPVEISKKENDVAVVIPLYSSIPYEVKKKLNYICNFNVCLGWRNQYCGIFSTDVDGVKYYFIDNEYYFKRNFMYGSFDDAERFAFFSKAVLEMLTHVDFIPDIIHTNDWQSALCGIYLKCGHFKHNIRYDNIRIVHSIHNIEYQGRYGTELLEDVFGIDYDYMDLLKYEGDLNLTKGAIECCDALVTVSPTYANEIQTKYYSHGLYHCLRNNSYKIHGILNGINQDQNDPETDVSINHNYNYKNLAGKEKCKASLQEWLGLPVDSDIPLVSMVTRLTEHKGIDLVIRVIDEMLSSDMQFVILGTGDRKYEDFFKGLVSRHPEKARALIKFDLSLSKKIYSSSDIFLMPSKSEPCGIAQMIASRYGAVPLVRECGGLYDTIKPFNEKTNEGNGFTFKNYNAHDMLHTFWRAFGIYKYNKKAWHNVTENAMSYDFSWDRSSEKYIQLYNSLIN